MMRNFNEFHSKSLKVRVQEALADNEKVVITGTSGGVTANRMLMTDAALINTALNDISTPRREAIIGELRRLSADTQLPPTNR